MQIAQIARAWGREPLVHFLLAGLAVFLFFGWRGVESDPQSRTIVVDEPLVERLAASWQQTWQRPPTGPELDGLIRDHVKEEVYAREALRLGLDADDVIIRRRLRSKMEFIAKSQIENQTPDKATLQAWLDKNPGKYAPSSTVSFDQLYLGGPEDASLTAAEIGQLMKRLKSTTTWRNSGRPISLPSTMDRVAVSEVERTFGAEFAALLHQQPRGVWAGPIASGFGAHLVRVRDVEAKTKPSLASVRQQVENDWRVATANKREAEAYQALLDGYTIEIEQP